MTPEAAVEEMYPILGSDSQFMVSHLKSKRTAFIAGHKSRDPEVERLVEALMEIAYSDEVSHIDSAESVAKEALKQYQK